MVKPSPKIRSRTRPPAVVTLENPTHKNHERKQNKENNEITTPVETKKINVLCNETEKTTVPPVPKLRKSKTKTENDSSEQQQEAEKVRIRKKKASPDPKVSLFI